MSDTFWLVETPATDNSPARWWHPEIGWCIDWNKALRFAREKDADDFAGSHHMRGALPRFASEHALLASPTPPAGDGWRNPSQLWARDLTDEELIDEYRRNEEACDRFDEARRDPDYEGHGGSPGEGLYERNEELEGQLKKRGLWPLPPPPVSKGEKL